MTWFKVDDKMHEDDKQNGAGITAVGLWTMCGSWAADNWSDGFVPRRVAARFIPRSMKLETVAQRLIEAGMWEPVEDGWMIVNFLKYNRSRAWRDAQREAAAERMRAHRDGHRSTRTSAEEPAKNPRTSLEEPPKVRKKRAKPQVSDDRSDEVLFAPYPYPSTTPETSSLVPQTATPSRGLAVVGGTEVEKIKEVNAGTLVAAWIDHRGGVAPTPRIMGQVSRELRNLLGAGIAPGVVYEGLINWQESGYAPSALSSFVDRALVQPSGVIAPKKIGSRTDQMATEALETLAWAREQDAKARGELA